MEVLVVSYFIETSKGKIDAKYIVNPAGLYTDKIAQDFAIMAQLINKKIKN